MKSGFLASCLGRLLLVALFFFVFLVGGLVAGVALHDPDTCWLLALGRLIVQTGTLPATDPYSFTFQTGDAKPFVMYQWLSEVVFYLSFKIGESAKVGGLSGLLYFVSTLLTTSFIALPVFYARLIGASSAFAIVSTVLLVLAACFHFLARPEIFSYLLLALWLISIALAIRLRTHQPPSAPQPPLPPQPAQPPPEAAIVDETEEPHASDPSAQPAAKIGWKAALLPACLMIVWCNLHTGFVIGLVYLFWLAVATGATILAGKKVRNAAEVLILLGASLAASLINPYGIGLWQYLPNLFFTPINSRIVELRPLSPKDLLEPTYYPYFALSIIALLLVVRSISHFKRDATEVDNGTFNGGILRDVLFSCSTVLIFAIAGWCCRRLIPFSSLIIAFEAFFLLSIANKGRAPAFFQQVDSAIDRVFEPRSFMWFVMTCVIASLGVFFVTSRVATPVLPQGSVAFQPPNEAIEFIESKRPAGRMLNHPQFGDMLIWRLGKPPGVFIDTRFDMYGYKIVDDYDTVAKAENGWERVLREYEVDWIFMPPKAKIVGELEKSADWREIFREDGAVIFSRVKE